MSLPDIINGSFELGAGLAVLHHCAAVQRDKEVRGISMLAVAFFVAWGLWNLFYYPHLGQPVSFYGGLFVTAANFLYVAMLWRYRRPDSIAKTGDASAPTTGGTQRKETPMKHELKQTVTIAASGEQGEVIGRAEYAHSEPAYLLRYKSADGRAVEQWWPESALA